MDTKKITNPRKGVSFFPSRKNAHILEAFHAHCEKNELNKAKSAIRAIGDWLEKEKVKF